MSKWIAEFDLEDGDIMPEYMDLNYMGAHIDFHCRPMWIPVSERLPEVGEKVLCQCQANIYEVLKLTVDGWYHDEKHCYMSGFVIAWMPLPEPYVTESEEV